MVVEYSYDAWGKLLSTTGTMADTLGVQNPFLYRGHYYDTETGLYYLNSRYYDPQTGRFINADSIGGQVGNLNSHNLFEYCGNNPITGADPTGHDWVDRLLDKVCGWFGFDSGFESTATGKYSDMYKVTSSFYMGIQTDNTYFSMNYAQLLSYSMQSAAYQDSVTANLSKSSSPASSSASNISPISTADAKRIQNTATRTKQNITVIGSRASGTATLTSDWDYILSGNSAQRHSAASSLPRGSAGGEYEYGIDIWTNYPNSTAANYAELDRTKPYIVFFPK